MSNKANVSVAGKRDSVLLPVAELRMKYDVRTRLNDDRVLFFMERYESGAEVPPIEVIRGTMDIHDGRHRKAALDHLGRKHAECILVAPMEYLDQMMDAFGKNVSDSPFPTTRADIVFVMKQLLEASVGNAVIQKRFEVYYKPSHVRKLLKDAHSNVLKTKMSKAKMAIAHGGVSIENAAKEHGVKVEKLQEEITGVKRRQKATDIKDVKSEISNRHRSNTARNVAVFRDVLDKFEDGELPEKDVLDVLLHVQRLNSDAAKRIDGWLERFEVLKGTSKAKS